MSLLATKSDLLAKRFQLVSLSREGIILESCNSLIDLQGCLGKMASQTFDWMVGTEAVILGLKANDPAFLLPMVEFAWQGRELMLDMEFWADADSGNILWLMSQENDGNRRLRRMQQERNESVILLEKLKAQDAALQEYTLRLEAVNKSLDRFAYIVSHDLKSPLRAIGNLASWIAEGIETGDHSELPEHLRLLKNRIQRMEGLIEGILLYSRAGRESVEPEVTDLKLMLQELAETNFKGRPYQLVLPAHMPPTMITKRIALFQVFSNLFSNASKYVKAENCLLELQFEENEQFFQFGLKDNGPGIEAKYHEKIFEIFQTLESKDKYESTGIGLTIVKKIVEDLGGKVWVVSEAGKGACFYFTWPKG